MTNLPFESASDRAHAASQHKQKLYEGEPAERRGCQNCGDGESHLFDVWTDDDERLNLCEDCASEVRRIEALAEELVAALASCETRRQIIETATSTRQLVAALRAHDMSCSCGSRKPVASDTAAAAADREVA